MADLQQLEDSIVGLSLLDAAQLVKKLEERLGVSAAAAARSVKGTVASRHIGLIADCSTEISLDRDRCAPESPRG